jgi:hypothetical protein
MPIAHLHQLHEVEFGGLQNLNLPEAIVLEWVDSLCRLLDLFSNHLRDEFRHQLLQVAGLSFPHHGSSHLSPDLQFRPRNSHLRHLLIHTGHT